MSEDVAKKVIDLPVVKALEDVITTFFGGFSYEAVFFGSSASPNTSVLSDIDLMIFVEDSFDLTAEKARDFARIFKQTMAAHGVTLDVEVPLEQKLIVPLEVALKAAQGSGLRFCDGRLLSISRTAAYLSSDEMLERLVLNVLTVPQVHVCGNRSLTNHIRDVASQTLVAFIQNLPTTGNSAATDCDSFIRGVISEGTRYGEEYLRYTDRTDVIGYLKAIWAKHQKQTRQGSSIFCNSKPSVASPRAGRVILLNGFPGVGKYSIGRIV